ncbi:MAG: hypothetical protein SVS15_08105 [Thermodesulfobacteriota bacterium]|nr:hypothetical protein [Thermodesulfobacteriota bacterium]
MEPSPANGHTFGSSFVEKDNMGTRQDTMDQASAYWMMRNVGQKFEPYVLFTFDRMEDARRALLDLDCIHEAQDTGNLICTRTLIFSDAINGRTARMRLLFAVMI